MTSLAPRASAPSPSPAIALLVLRLRLRLGLGLGLGLIATACGGKLPDTRYYLLAASGPGFGRPAATPAAAPAPVTNAGDAAEPAAPTELRGDVLVVETPTADAAYDDDRIVYRTTPFRLDYYQYHRWSSPPGTMVGNYLEQAFETSGKFRAVVRDATPDAPVILAGRVVAIEEVDRSKTEWVGRIVLELMLTDSHSGESLWTTQIEETEPLHQQNPEGLAAALSVAMGRITARIVPIVAGITEHQARLHAEHAPTTALRSDAGTSARNAER